MNIGELKEFIKDIPDDFKVGGLDPLKYFLDIYKVEVKKIHIPETKRINDFKALIFIF